MKMSQTGTLALLGLVVVSAPLLALGDADPQAASRKKLEAESQRIVAQYKAVMDTVGQPAPSSRNVIGCPILGNGSLGVVISANPQSWPLQFWTCKSSFSKLRHDHRKSGPRPFGGLDVNIPALRGCSRHTEQDLYTAVTTGRFATNSASLSMRAFTAATEDLLIVELTNDGKEALVGTLGMWALPGRGSREKVSTNDAGKVVWAVKEYLSGPEGGTHPSEIPTLAASAARVVGGGGFGIDLPPWKKMTIALALKSNYDEKDPPAAVQQLVLGLTEEKVRDLEKKHLEWWRNYWTRSLVEIGDPAIEKDYYLYYYQSGSSLRDKVFPPGLFGLWTTHDDPNWCGDYHLNFDFQSQYWALYKANYIRQAECFHQPVLDFIERGRWYATNVLRCRGVYYPVGIWAKGMESSRQPGRKIQAVEQGGVFMGQKCNTGYCVATMAMHWYHTYDLDYARTVYPFLIECANFWEDYLRFEPAGARAPTNFAGLPPQALIDGVPADAIPVGKLPPGRYSIYDSAIQEDHFGDYNNPMDLGLTHCLFTLMLDMTKEMGVDAARREKWEHILKNLAPFPTFEKDGKTVFRYSEKGTEWIDGNSVGLHHIYPAGVIGPDDDPKLIEIARNMLDAKGRPWDNDNGLNSHYPAAVRMGYDPEKLLERLRGFGRMSNGFQGSIESSTLPNTINEMLCMSHKQVLRVFANWPRNKDARFWTLRAEGAFLVSSALKGGKVQFVRIASEKGRDCTVVNPWPGQPIDVYRDGKKAETVNATGDRTVLKTKPGEILMLVPEGDAFPKEEA